MEDNKNADFDFDTLVKKDEVQKKEDAKPDFDFDALVKKKEESKLKSPSASGTSASVHGTSEPTKPNDLQKEGQGVLVVKNSKSPGFPMPEAALPPKRFIPEIEKKSYDELKNIIKNELADNKDYFKTQKSVDNYVSKLQAQGYSKSTAERLKAYATVVPAIKNAEDAMKKDPTNRDIANQYAALNIKAGDYDNAYKTYEQMLKTPNEKKTFVQGNGGVAPQEVTDNSIMYGMGYAKQLEGDTDTAMKWYNKVANGDPNSVVTINSIKALAGIAYKKGDKEQSQRLMETANLYDEKRKASTGSYEENQYALREEQKHENDTRDRLNTIANGIGSMVLNMTPIGAAFTGFEEGGKKIKEGIDSFNSGKNLQGSLQILDGTSKAVIGGVMATTPEGALFDFVSKGAEQVLPQQIVSGLMQPISTVLANFSNNPSETVKSLASLADVIVGAALLHKVTGIGEEAIRKFKDNEPLNREDVNAIQQSVSQATPEEIESVVKKVEDENSHKVKNPKIEELHAQKEDLLNVINNPETDPSVAEATHKLIDNIDQDINKEIEYQTKESHDQAKKDSDIKEIDDNIDTLKRVLNAVEGPAKELVKKQIDEFENQKNKLTSKTETDEKTSNNENGQLGSGSQGTNQEIVGERKEGENEQTEKEKVGDAIQEPSTTQEVPRNGEGGEDKSQESETLGQGEQGEKAPQEEEKVIPVRNEGVEYGVRLPSSESEKVRIFKDGEELTPLNNTEVKLFRKLEAEAKRQQQNLSSNSKIATENDIARMGLTELHNSDPERFNEDVMGKAMNMSDAEINEIESRVLKDPKTALTVVEMAALAKRRVDIDTRRDELITMLENAKTPEEESDIKMKLKNLNEKIDEFNKVTKSAGSVAGKVLNTLRNVYSKDYTPSVIRGKFAAQFPDTKIPEELSKRIDELTTEMSKSDAKVEELAKKYEKLEDEIREISKKTDINKAVRKEDMANKNRPKLTKEEILAERDRIRENMKRIFEESRSTLGSMNIKESVELSGEVAKLALNYIKEGLVNAKEIIEKVFEDLKAIGIDAKEEDVEDIIHEQIVSEQIKEDKKVPLSLEKDGENKIRIAQKRLKRQYERAIDDYEKRLKYIDENKEAPEKKEQQKTPLNEELLELKGKLNDLKKLNKDAEDAIAKKEESKNKIDIKLKQVKERQKGKYEQFLRGLGKARTSFLFTTPTTLLKLTSAGIELAITKPISEMGKYYYGRINPLTRDIARNAPIYGNTSAHAISEYYQEFGNVENFKEVGRAILGRARFDMIENDNVYDNAIYKENLKSFRDYVGASLAIPGNIHGAIKLVPKKAEYKSSYAEAEEWYRRTHKISPSEELSENALAQIHGLAYDNALASILMDNNSWSSAWSRMIDNGLKSENVLVQTASGLAGLLVPITKVPLNFASQLIDAIPASHLIDFGKESMAIRKAAKDGTLTPERADKYMRSLNRQFVGATLSTFFAVAIKTGAIKVLSDEDVKKAKKEGKKVLPGGVVLSDGVTVNPLLLHNASLAFGIKAARQFDALSGGNEGSTEALYSNVKEASKDVPYVSLASDVERGLQNEKQLAAVSGNIVGGIISPGIAKYIAKWTDQEADRQPQDFWDNVKMNLPILRKQVPLREKVKFDKAVARQLQRMEEKRNMANISDAEREKMVKGKMDKAIKSAKFKQDVRNKIIQDYDGK